MVGTTPPQKNADKNAKKVGTGKKGSQHKPLNNSDGEVSTDFQAKCELPPSCNLQQALIKEVENLNAHFNRKLNGLKQVIVEKNNVIAKLEKIL